MPARDPHEVLGVPRSASHDEIKAAYRRLAKRHHPDANPGDPDADARFREIAEAWEALRDPKPRSKAQPRTRRPDASSRRSASGAGANAQARTRAARPPRGPDIDADVTITLEEAFAGTTVRLTVPELTDCPACDGTGDAHRRPARPCPACDGRGRMRASDAFGHSEIPCPVCHGRGRLVPDPCVRCAGEGERASLREVPVPLPPGVEDGRMFRLKGEGPMGARERGDIYLAIAVKPHRLFRRDGADLLCEVAVPMHAAALGTRIELRTIDGSAVAISVPKGTQPGARLRLKGKGMPNGGGRGDLYVTIRVKIPTGLTSKQEALLRRFADSLASC